MEQLEEKAQINYQNLRKEIPEAAKIIKAEEKHEDALINLISEDRIEYIGAIARGLNEAIIEIIGEIAGLAFVLNQPNLIAIVIFITGLSASFSLGGTEFLAIRTERNSDAPARASIYAVTANMVTVILLITPFLIFKNIFYGLGLAIIIATAVITTFSYYVSTVNQTSFKKRVIETGLLSLGIAALVFIIGKALQTALHAGYVRVSTRKQMNRKSSTDSSTPNPYLKTREKFL